MKIKRRRSVLSAAVALLALAAISTSSWAQRTELLEVRGGVKTALRLSVDDLKAFAPAQIGSFTQTRRSDGGESASTVRGVRLTAVLERAALAAEGKNDWKASIVLATASDGYRVAFSWPELFNSPLGPQVLVLFERDGKALDDQEGRIALISAGDQRSGPRHVRWLQSIEVRTLLP